MISTVFNLVFYQPMYNGLVFLMSVIPGADMGISVILLTIIVKLILFPLSHKSAKTQVMMKKIEPEINEIKSKYKDKQEQSKKTMELYNKYKINPFSGCFLLLVQLPVIFSLYWVFLKELDLNYDLIYSFVTIPEIINTTFLGIFDLTKNHNIILAIFAGLSQFVYVRFTMKKNESSSKVSKKGPVVNSFKDEFMKGMSLQMKYVLPIFIIFISYTLVSAVSLYWTISNLYSLGQEYWIRKRIDKMDEKEEDEKKEDNI